MFFIKGNKYYWPDSMKSFPLAASRVVFLFKFEVMKLCNSSNFISSIGICCSRLKKPIKPLSTLHFINLGILKIFIEEMLK